MSSLESRMEELKAFGGVDVSKLTAGPADSNRGQAKRTDPTERTERRVSLG
jgi:hypothetical protein